jgi:ABC-2 type transport system ATP-binding protein
MPGLMIETRALRVDYGDLIAVDNLDLAVEEGEIYGLIGPNGAGKTSTIRVLATLQEPTYGDVFIAGLDVVEQRRQVQRVLGYMPDFAPVYDDLTVREFLEMFAAAYHLPNQASLVEEVLTLTALNDRAKVMAGTLSRGYMQRLVLAKTLLHDPKVMLLDEPASGLDPLARIELRELLKRLVGRGTTVLVSSHILTELAELCSSIGIMREGRLVVSGSIDEVVASRTTARRYSIQLAHPSPALLDILRAHDAVSGAEESARGAEIELAGGDEEAARLLRELVERGLPICQFQQRVKGVEDVFLEVGGHESVRSGEGRR